MPDLWRQYNGLIFKGLNVFLDSLPRNLKGKEDKTVTVHAVIRHEDMAGGSIGTTPLILNVGTRI